MSESITDNDTGKIPDGTEHDSGRLLIIGAGTMGRGIAEAALLNGLDVTLCDSRPDALQNSVQWLHEQPGISQSCVPGVATSVEEAVSDGSIQLAVESVAEIPEIKQQVLAELEACLPVDTLIATNTSSITLSRLSAGCRNPERYLGMHFCHPVRHRSLVEIVRGDHTSRAALRAAESIAARLGKVAVLVHDSPGFVINRLLVAYLNEAMALLIEGVDIEDIDAAAVAFGMPTGPFEQIDRMGVDVAVRVGTHQFFAFPDRVVPSALLVKVMKSGRVGLKSGCGFFQWTDDGRRGAVDPWVKQLIVERSTPSAPLSAEALQMRLFLPMLLEGQRIIVEGLLACPNSIDDALWRGLDFRPWDVGLMRWALSDSQGTIPAFCRQFEHLGPRFHPPVFRRAA